jgi:uncharacterized protein YciI
MFVALVHYIKPLPEVDLHLVAHREYLQTFVDQGKLLISGRRDDAKGGVILLNLPNREQADAFIHGDPFYQAQVASYELIEFKPTKVLPVLAPLLTQT